MLIFFDTEFSGLTSDPRLLSIGFVADDGSELYVEFLDGWSEENCSPWVREHVLPLLGDGELLTRRDAARRIHLWLTSIEKEPTVMGETDWDTTLLANLLRENHIAPDSCALLKILNKISKSQVKSFEVAKQSYFDSNGVTQHQALNDARAFRVAWHMIFSNSCDSCD